MSIHKFRKKFTKAYKLPIHVFQTPYFEYLLDLYEPIYNCKRAYATALFHLYMDYEGGEDFDESLKYWINDEDRVQNEVIEDLRNSPNSQDLIHCDMKSFKTLEVPTKSSENFYSEDNSGKRFISIDFEKANFNIFRKFGIIEEDSYYNFISKYTDNEFFRQSSYMRQVIFGRVAPKKQRNLEKYYALELANKLIEFGVSECYMIGSDELIIEDTGDNKIHDIIMENTPLPVKVRKFELKLLDSERQVYVKDFIGEYGFELKNAPAHFFPQYYKYYMDLQLNDYDLVFYYDGEIASFHESVIKGT